MNPRTLVKRIVLTLLQTRILPVPVAAWLLSRPGIRRA